MTPVINAQVLAHLHAHFRSLDRIDFLTDCYTAVGADYGRQVCAAVAVRKDGLLQSLAA